MQRLKKGREELEWLEAEGATRFDHVLLNDELGCEQSIVFRHLSCVQQELPMQIYLFNLIMVITWYFSIRTPAPNLYI